MSKENHGDLARIVEMTREANDQKYEAHSKTMLKKHITTKFKTTMIGALSHFENLFGHLWGHEVPDSEKSDTEREWNEKWQLARTEILNNGNNQLRAALAEVDQHVVRYQKHEYQFQVKGNEDITENE